MAIIIKIIPGYVLQSFEAGEGEQPRFFAQEFIVSEEAAIGGVDYDLEDLEELPKDEIEGIIQDIPNIPCGMLQPWVGEYPHGYHIVVGEYDGYFSVVNGSGTLIALFIEKQDAELFCNDMNSRLFPCVD